MLTRCLARLRRRIRRGVDTLCTRVRRWTTPCPLAAGLATDIVRSRRELVVLADKSIRVSSCGALVGVAAEHG
jgi:hypothetical protein